MYWTILSTLLGIWMLSDSSVTMRITNEVIVLDRDSSNMVSASFIISNETEADWLLYGLNFRDVAHAFDFEEGYCNGDIGAGTTGFIFNENNEQVFAEISASPPDSIDYKPIDIDQVQKALDQAKSRYIESKLLIKSGESLRVEKVYNLKKYELEKGIYKLFLIYHAGEYTV
ncbi:MAG: hypothetical protein OEY56_14325, partial [Cyclobacteriaceae bacterium]|nr:hypothetical protein [Cyclobacteriaceae bacterium]